MDGMLHQMPSRLLIEWMAFYGLEPFGYEANFQGHALTASVLAEVNRDPKKRHERYTTADFMPTEQQDEDERPSVFKRLKDYLVSNSQTSRKG